MKIIKTMKTMSYLKRVVAIAACLASFAFFAACEKEEAIDPDAPVITAFSFDGQAGSAVIEPQKRTLKATAACGTNIASLTPTFTLSPGGTTAKVDHITQVSGTTAVNFSEPVTYILTTAEGETANWTVTIVLPDDCPPCGEYFNSKGIAKMTSLGKTIPNERVVVRSADEYNWGTEMEVLIPDNDPNVWSFGVRYVFFYCIDYYEKQKKLDEQRTEILEYDNEGLWYSWRISRPWDTYQEIYDAFANDWQWEIVK